MNLALVITALMERLGVESIQIPERELAASDRWRIYTASTGDGVVIERRLVEEGPVQEGLFE